MAIHDNLDEARTVLVVTTVSNESEAIALTEKLLEFRLAACVSQRDIRSTYRWQGRIERAHEIELTIKTSSKQKAPLLEYLKDHHPYTTPEIVALRVTDVSPEYAKWVAKETDPDQNPPAI